MTDIDRPPRRPNIRSSQPESKAQFDGVIGAIIAVDPGTTTGLAYYKPSRHKLPRECVHVLEFKQGEHRELATKLRGLSPADNPAVLVYEQYVARPSAHGHLGGEAKYQFSPIYVHGYMVGLMEACRKPEHMPTFVPQQASMMAGMPDKRLKTMFDPFYTLTLSPAKPHARDALRHLLVYIRKAHPKLFPLLRDPMSGYDHS